jgi:hypothetical protein
VITMGFLGYVAMCGFLMTMEPGGILESLPTSVVRTGKRVFPGAVFESALSYQDLMKNLLCGRIVNIERCFLSDE